MCNAGASAEELLAGLRARVEARAAGWWRVAGDRLEQVAFLTAEDMPAEVTREFARATRSVHIEQASLGIVGAARTGQVTVSRVDELPADSGSGHWLRRFAAARSVAVPVRDRSGALVRVVSVALVGSSADDALIARIISDEASCWVEGPERG